MKKIIYLICLLSPMFFTSCLVGVEDLETDIQNKFKNYDLSNGTASGGNGSGSSSSNNNGNWGSHAANCEASVSDYVLLVDCAAFKMEFSNSANYYQAYFSNSDYNWDQMMSIFSDMEFISKKYDILETEYVPLMVPKYLYVLARETDRIYGSMSQYTLPRNEISDETSRTRISNVSSTKFTVSSTTNFAYIVLTDNEAKEADKMTDAGIFLKYYDSKAKLSSSYSYFGNEYSISESGTSQAKEVLILTRCYVQRNNKTYWSSYTTREYKKF